MEEQSAGSFGFDAAGVMTDNSPFFYGVENALVRAEGILSMRLITSFGLVNMSAPTNPA